MIAMDQQQTLNTKRIISIAMLKPQVYVYVYVGSGLLHFFNFD